ncbi:MAG: diaminopimelate decarboxylase [Candidatus Eremiobacteraeota bacterium]|nr:diaminopimelate decarboxylase [Candidatus Eremiobacteraeota bacterium]MBV8654408.1 diaminopimelate decarboxylase [Candidatus Eremiobacteraeota bacterium]
MRISGVDALELVRTYGTPLTVVNVDAIDAAIAALHVACDRYKTEIAYAAKAFFCVELARHLTGHSGLALDVCSLGELVTAERGGFPANRITLHGAGKSDDELRAALERRVGRIVVDSAAELDRLAELRSGDARLDVMLRLNTGIEAHTHAFVRTGGDDTKFGIAQNDEAAAAAALLAHPWMRFAGLHAHVGSQIYDGAPFVANSHALVEAAARFASHGLVAERIVIGGGFGVQMRPNAGDEKFDMVTTIADVARCVRECAADLGMPPPNVGIEPGRAIVAAAGTTLYRVLAVKRQHSRTFAIVDGGMYENPRPAIYGAHHHVVAVTGHSSERVEMTLCGRTCENDELGAAVLPKNLAAGDVLAMLATGAYTFGMAGNYNRLPRPAVVAVHAGEHRLWVRRETVDDVLARDTGA